MACERPDDRGRSLSAWDCREMARQLAAEGVVPSLSPDTVRRIPCAGTLADMPMVWGGKPLYRCVLCPATTDRHEGLPMAILRAAGEALQRALGPELDQLGRDTGAIRRRRKFTGMTLVRTLVWTVLRVGRPKADDYATTAGMLGVAVTSRAIEKRFTARLVAFLRAALERLVPEALTAAPVAVPLLARFTAVLVGDSTALTLPDAYAAEFPGCGGKAGSGRAALKVQVLWDLAAGR